MNNTSFLAACPLGVATCSRNSCTVSPQDASFKIELQTNPPTVLTRFCNNDVHDLFEVYSNLYTMQYMGGAMRTLPEVALTLGQYYRIWEKYQTGPLAIRDKFTDRVIGRTGLRISESEEAVELFPFNGSDPIPLKLSDRWQIGWVLSPEFRGKGIATQAAKRVLEYAFEVKKVDEVAAFIRIENVASVKVARKLGMSLVGSFMCNGYLWEYHSLSQENYSSDWK
jgi:ribosomal-protein-alanine N-acetyltransferase